MRSRALIIRGMTHSPSTCRNAIRAAPYFWSLLTLNPDISYVTPMPWLVKLHIINAYLLILLFPFTRLVHVLVVPNPYLWRKPQVVRWAWNPSIVRKAR